MDHGNGSARNDINFNNQARMMDMDSDDGLESSDSVERQINLFN